MTETVANELKIVTGKSFEDYLRDKPCYFFLSNTSEWDDEQNPPETQDTTASKVLSLSNVIGLKRIAPKDVYPVIPKYEWQSGVVYDQYDDTVDLISNQVQFYVLTEDNRVYKCIKNANGTPSTVKPNTLEMTTYDDGYMWKFMYSVKPEDVSKFVSTSWIPCYDSPLVDDSTHQFQVEQKALAGAIHNVIVVDGGSGYQDGVQPSYSVSGDGQGLELEFVIEDGSIKDVIIINGGVGYFSATIQIDGNAEVRPVISPFGGHGYNAQSELGATQRMIHIKLEGSENGSLPVGISYRTIGIMSKALSNDAGALIRVSDSLRFKVGDHIVGQTTGAEGTVRMVEHGSGVIYIEDVVGQFGSGEILSNQSGLKSRVLNITTSEHLPLTSTVSDGSNYLKCSGKLLYYVNIEPTTRTEEQIEEYKFTVSF